MSSLPWSAADASVRGGSERQRLLGGHRLNDAGARRAAGGGRTRRGEAEGEEVTQGMEGGGGGAEGGGRLAGC